MSEANQEPTMEEILASIRRIISEDEETPAGEGEETAAEAELEAEEAEPVLEAPVLVEAVEEEEVLELTERVDEAAPAETHGDIDVYAASEPEAQPPPPIRSAADDEPLLGRIAAESAASAFGQLAHSLTMPQEGRTLEDVVRELLRPLLKAWLDEHLAGIVQARVEAEVERVARTRGR